MKDNQKEKFTLKERLQYGFDNVMSRGTIAMVEILFAITALVVIVAGILVVIFDGKPDSTIGGGIWVSLMHAIDAGTLTADSGSFLFMILMTLVTICGLFITSVLIGIVNTGMQDKMESLRKGKSRVLEKNHVVILGYNRNLLILLRELLEANANQPRSVVVIMDDKMEKEAMEDGIRQRFPDTGSTRIICRCGDPADLNDLQVCSPAYAKSIIINSDEDFATIKSILAMTTLLKQAGNTDAFMTAVIHDRDNYEAARLAGENRAEILFFDDTIARILAQTSRQSGLSLVYTGLFEFAGDEIYLESVPKMVGKPMKELNLWFPHSSIIGLEKGEMLCLNPDGDMTVAEGDRLILIAEDDGVSIPSDEPGEIDETAIVQTTENSPERRRKMLILGYGPRLGRILEEEDKYMAPGSRILLAVQEEYAQQAEDMVRPSYNNIDVHLYSGNLFCRTMLRDLLDWEPDSILVTNSLQADPQVDDNETLVLLLQLRALAREKQKFHMVTSEMRDVKNQELAQITEVRDFVISSNITSLMVSQISQCRPLSRIFTELLTDEGMEIYMRPASDYVELGREVNIYTACAAATHKGQAFMGYRHTDPETNKLEVHINPDKDQVVRFERDDRFVVLAEH